MKKYFSIFTKIFKKYSLLLKLLFVSSVMLFVINQLFSILHGMTWKHLIDLIKDQGFVSIFSMLITGFIVVLPMILYDVGTINTLKLNISKRKVINDGWIINTINNLAGFGGVIGVTLRMNRYGNLKKDTKVVGTITKTAFFLLTGLSILSFITFMLLLFNPNSPYHHYLFCLGMGSLYAPGLLVFIKINKHKLFKDFTWKNIVIFYSASIGQWLGALLIFLVIGRQLIPELNMLQVAPLFVAATIIGMLTMVPGGIGTFDVLIILGLNVIGIPKAVSLIWILFYRIFYYIIPFASGITLLVHQTGKAINKLLDDMPKLFCTKVAHFVITIIMYLAGLMTIILSTMPNLTLISKFFAELLPLSFASFDQTLNMMIGLLLIGLARGVYNKVKRAYDLSIIILIFCIINALLAQLSLKLVIFYSIVLISLYLARHEFYREKFVYSWSAMIFDSLIFSIVFIFYAVVGVIANSNHKTIKSFIFFPSDKVWFSGLTGLLLALLLLIALYHYLSAHRNIGDGFNDTRLQSFLEKYKTSYYQQLAYLKNYQFYYYQKDNIDTVCFMFKIKANRCIVLGNPLGSQEYYKEAAEEFMTTIDIYDYQAIFYNINQEFSLVLHDLGYRFMKISELGIHIQQQDTCVSSSTKELSVHEIYQNLPRLREISQIFEKGQKYKSFAAGRYERDFVLSSKVLVHLNKQGQIQAYCVLSQPINKRISLMYVHSTCDNNETFMADILGWCDKQNYTLELGYSPLASVGTSNYSFLEERIIRLIYSYGNQATHFEKTYRSLVTYVTEWQPAYLAYPMHQNFYILMLQIVTLILQRKEKKNGLL